MNAQVTEAERFLSLGRVAIFGVGMLALAATWFILFTWIAAATEGWLVPWDTAPGRPPAGTWQRTLNDFFEAWPGAMVPAAFVILTGALIFVMRAVREDRRAFLPLEFAVTNLLFLIADRMLVILAHELPDLWLPQPRPALDMGYHRTWPAIAVTALLLCVLFRVQSTGQVRRAVRRKG